MRISFSRFAVALGLIAASFTPVDRSSAMPANPHAMNFKQPNGKTISLTTKGDEFQGWQETMEGYTVVKNRTTGYFEYAKPNTHGELVPSGLVATNVFHLTPPPPRPVGAPAAPASPAAPRFALPIKGLRPPRNTALEKSQGTWLQEIGGNESLRLEPEARFALALKLANGDKATGEFAQNSPATPPTVTGTWAPHPVLGNKKLLVILVNFQDVKIKQPISYWSDAVFGQDGTSVSAFYKDNSYGKVTIEPVTHTQQNSPPGVVTVSLATANPNYGNQFNYVGETTWINAALIEAAKYVDFPSLDVNGDGTITVDEALIYFILAGYESAAGSGLTPAVWAHRWGGDGVTVSGKAINNWALNGEMYDAAAPMKMGVVAHEMGHAMGGLPDLYDTSNFNSGIGAFSVMAGGAWGAGPGETPGQTPVGFDAWSRYYLGWSTPRLSTNGSKVTLVSGLTDSSSSLLLINPTKSTSEYWLVENRPPVSWDRGMTELLGGTWTGGLLVLHIDSNIGDQSNNSFNTYVPGKHQGNTVVEPSTAKCSLVKNSNSLGCPTLLYYSGNESAFDNASKPASSYYSGGSSTVGLRIVSISGQTMTAEVEEP